MDYLSEGSVAPDFELFTREGLAFKLSDAVTSGPIALAFYKSSCPTCQFTFPFIQSIFRGLRGDAQPRIWGISQDDPSETSSFIAQHGLEFPILIDPHPYAVSTAFNLRFVPTLYLIEVQRRIEVADFGFSKPALGAIARRLAEGLGCRVPEVFSPDDGIPERRPG